MEIIMYFQRFFVFEKQYRAQFFKLYSWSNKRINAIIGERSKYGRRRKTHCGS